MKDAVGRGMLLSIRKRVAAELSEHMAQNKALRRRLHPLYQRVLRFLVCQPFYTFLLAYLGLDAALQLAAIAQETWWACLGPLWGPPAAKGLLKDAAGFLITAQVGILGVISVAVGLVTLIAQRNDGAGTNADIRIYYAESLAYGVASSSIALLVVMCAEVFWPFQHIARHYGFDQQNVSIKVVLTAVHVIWLSINLAAFSQFVHVSLRFVEPKARERLREEYTANTVLRQDLSKRMNAYFLQQAREVLRPKSGDPDDLMLRMGPFGSGDQWDEEQSVKFGRPFLLRDIRLRFLRWALRSWWKRNRIGEFGNG